MRYITLAASLFGVLALALPIPQGGNGHGPVHSVPGIHKLTHANGHSRHGHAAASTNNHSTINADAGGTQGQQQYNESYSYEIVIHKPLHLIPFVTGPGPYRPAQYDEYVDESNNKVVQLPTHHVVHIGPDGRVIPTEQHIPKPNNHSIFGNQGTIPQASSGQQPDRGIHIHVTHSHAFDAGFTPAPLRHWHHRPHHHNHGQEYGNHWHLEANHSAVVVHGGDGHTTIVHPPHHTHHAGLPGHNLHPQFNHPGGSHHGGFGIPGPHGPMTMVHPVTAQHNGSPISHHGIPHTAAPLMTHHVHGHDRHSHAAIAQTPGVPHPSHTAAPLMHHLHPKPGHHEGVPIPGPDGHTTVVHPPAHTIHKPTVAGFHHLHPKPNYRGGIAVPGADGHTTVVHPPVHTLHKPNHPLFHHLHPKPGPHGGVVFPGAEGHHPKLGSNQQRPGGTHQPWLPVHQEHQHFTDIGVDVVAHKTVWTQHHHATPKPLVWPFGHPQHGQGSVSGGQHTGAHVLHHPQPAATGNKPVVGKPKWQHGHPLFPHPVFNHPAAKPVFDHPAIKPILDHPIFDHPAFAVPHRPAPIQSKPQHTGAIVWPNGQVLPEKPKPIIDSSNSKSESDSDSDSDSDDKSDDENSVKHSNHQSVQPKLVASKPHPLLDNPLWKHPHSPPKPLVPVGSKPAAKPKPIIGDSDMDDDSNDEKAPVKPKPVEHKPGHQLHKPVIEDSDSDSDSDDEKIDAKSKPVEHQHVVDDSDSDNERDDEDNKVQKKPKPFAKGSITFWGYKSRPYNPSQPGADDSDSDGEDDNKGVKMAAADASARSKHKQPNLSTGNDSESDDEDEEIERAFLNLVDDLDSKDHGDGRAHLKAKNHLKVEDGKKRG